MLQLRTLARSIVRGNSFMFEASTSAGIPVSSPHLPPPTRTPFGPLVSSLSSWGDSHGEDPSGVGAPSCKREGSQAGGSQALRSIPSLHISHGFCTRAKDSPAPAGDVAAPAQDIEARLMAVAQNAAQSTFFTALKAHVRAAAPTADVGQVDELLRLRFQECWERHKHRAVGRSMGAVTSACLVVAANRVAGPWLGKDPEAFRTLLKSLLGGSSSAAFGWVHRLSMSLRRDKLGFVGGLMDRMKTDWGPSFESIRQKGEGMEGVIVSKCCYNEILTEEGIPEYVSLFCALEREWFDTLRMEKRGIQFTVPATMAQGKTNCIFLAVEEEK